jgi:hypothetical protein
VTETGYVEGAPEFIAEVAYSSQSIDLHDKKLRYASGGVQEYVVVCLKEHKLRWFDLAANKELQPAEDGICRIGVFPGLWIDGPALLAHDYSRLMRTLEQGLATPEHAAFVERLARQKTI